MTAETEREAVVRYLGEEADDCIAYNEAFGPSNLADMAVLRAGFYRQAAAFIGRGEHLRTDRLRPSWSIAKLEPTDHAR